MATPLTDSINALTTYANEVTGASDTNLSDAVKSLADGYAAGKNLLTKVQSLYYLFYQQELDENQVFDFGGNVITNSSEYFLSNTTGAKTVTIKNVTINGNMQFAFNGGSYETLEFVNCTIKPKRCNRMFGSSTLKHVIGEIDMSECTSGTDPLYFSRVLEDIRFTENSIKMSSFTLVGNVNHLNESSLVSIANALNDSVSGSLSPVDAVPRINTIMGNNVDGLFVADPNGIMSLVDFITNIKGWTLA